MAKKKTRSSKKTKTRAAPAKAKSKSKSKSVSKKRPAKVATKTRAKATPKKKRASKVTSKTRTKARAKVAPKKKRAVKATSKTKSRAKMPPKRIVARPARPPRRDATGHLDPKYARELRARSLESRNDDDEDRTYFRKARSHDDLAEELGEEAVATMTSGEDQTDRLQDAEVEEEQGGPFVTTKDSEEFAQGTDKSNPRGATREPFPRT